MITLLKYWPALVGAALMWLVHLALIQGYEAKFKAQEVALIQQCEASKKITTEVSNEYQKKLAALNADIKRLSKCEPVPITRAASGYNAGPSGAQPARTDAVTDTSLYEFAGDAEKYRIQLKSCQSFIRKVWGR